MVYDRTPKILVKAKGIVWDDKGMEVLVVSDTTMTTSIDVYLNECRIVCVRECRVSRPSERAGTTP
jgi:hypothetical protein